MKKVLSSILIVVLTAVFLCAAACDSDSPSETPKKLFNEIKNGQIFLYDTITLKLSDGIDKDKIAFTSSDNSILTVEKTAQRITLTGKAVGKATLSAAYGNSEQKQEIKVVESDTSLVVTAENLSLLVGLPYIPEPSLTFEGKAVDGATFEFESENPDIAAIENNAVKGLTAGTANIKIIAKINGSVVAQGSFYCYINKNEGIHPLHVKYDLYASENVLGQSFRTSLPLLATVYKDGVVEDSSNIVWTIDDDQIAKIENGTIKSVKVGNTFVVGEYRGSDGSILKTQQLPVNVKVSVIESDEDVIIDKNQDKVILNAEALLGKSNINKIEDLSKSKAYSISDNSVATMLFSAGEHTCVCYSSDNTAGVKINFVAADFVVYDKEDLMLMPSFSKGYIVLANDLDDIDFVNAYNVSFTGVLNGLGHKLSNIRYKTAGSGLFAQTNGATIKNISITDAILEGPPKGDKGSMAAIMYRNSGGETVIDNVYIDISRHERSFAVGGVVALCFQGKVKITNTLIYVHDFGNNGMIAGRNNSQIILENCYVIGNGPYLCGIGGSDNRNYATLNRISGVAYSDETAFITAIENGKVSFSGFSTKYWKFDNDIPFI